MNTLWIDVTSFNKRTQPLTGVPRVEVELIQWAQNNIQKLKFFEYDLNSRKFIEWGDNLPVFQEITISSHPQNDELSPPKFKGFFLKCSFYEIKFNTKRVFQALGGFLTAFRITHPFILRHNLSRIKHHSKLVLKAVYSLSMSFVNENYRRNIHLWIKKKYHKFNVAKEFFQDIQYTLQATSETQAIIKPVHPFQDGDSILFAGMVWRYLSVNEEIYSIKKQVKLFVYTICHDLIPVKFPHFCLHEGGLSGHEIFNPYFITMTNIANHVFCVSKSTERDYKAFVKERKLICPVTSVVKSGCEILQKDHPPSPLIKNLLKTEFILFVSTIERRKNHDGIYKAILYLLENNYKNLPKFVFVGMTGWSVNELMSDLKLDPRIKDRIIVLHGISDPDLKSLYKRALFSIYPSFYEGWGMPIAESLNYGKMVIASSTSSMPEVGGDLIDYVHPYDIIGWAKRIAFYLDNRDELARKEQEIREKFQKHSWNDFCVQVFKKINESQGLS